MLKKHKDAWKIEKIAYKEGGGCTCTRMLGIIVQIILLQEGSILIQGKKVYSKHINTRVREYMQSLTIVVILIVLQLIQVDSNLFNIF